MTCEACDVDYEKVEGDRAIAPLTEREVEAIVLINMESWHVSQL